MSSKHSDITRELASQTFSGIRNQLESRPALSRVASKFQQSDACTNLRRKRIILLNLDDPEELGFWQILHNTPEKFQIISEKESHQKGEYFTRIIFHEMGDELPIVKTRQQFISEYSKLINAQLNDA